MESAILNPYTKLFELEKNQEPDESVFYLTMSKALIVVAENYNTSNSEDIYMGYVELAALIQTLSDMFQNTNYAIDDINELKKMIKGEFECLILDLENHFESYPDEISKRDIEIGNILTKGGFLIHEKNS